MKTYINLLAGCFLFASVLMVPQAANAITPALVPPCTNASLANLSFGYELRGYADTIRIGRIPFALIVTTQVGRWDFKGDAAGTFTDIFSNSVDGVEFTTEDTSAGTSNLSADCKTLTMNVHGWYAQYEFALSPAQILYPCAHVQVNLGPTPILLGNLKEPPPPGGPIVLDTKILLADGAVNCTDSSSVVFVKRKGTDVTFTLTGTMTQQ